MWFSPKRAYDPLLHRFFAARTQKEADSVFQVLWTKELCREAEQTLHKHMPRREEHEKREELVAETEYSLYKILNGQRSQEAEGARIPRQQEIMNARAYTRMIVKNLFVNYLRKRNPAWRQINQKMLSALQTHPELELWETEPPHAVSMAGLRAWSRRMTAITAEAQQFLEGDYANFRQHQLDNQSPMEIVGANMAGLPLLIGHILAWVEIPLLADTLMFYLAQFLELKETDSEVSGRKAGAGQRRNTGHKRYIRGYSGSGGAHGVDAPGREVDVRYR